MSWGRCHRGTRLWSQLQGHLTEAKHQSRLPPSRLPRTVGLTHRVTVLGAVPSLTQQQSTASSRSGHVKLLNIRPAGHLRGRRASPGSHFCVTFLSWSSRPAFPATFRILCHSPAHVRDPFVWQSTLFLLKTSAPDCAPTHA